jgi:signal transduction histidine kinase/ActR/RegA family two-component response regulator
MSVPERKSSEERILVLAPVGRDADLACRALSGVGLYAEACPEVGALCRAIESGAGAALVTAEGLSVRAAERLLRTLLDQPPWSDLPLVILPGRGEPEPATGLWSRFAALRNVTFLDRPVRMRTLISSLRAALEARRRQYELRDLLRRLEQAVRDREQFLAVLSHELRTPLSAIANAAHLLQVLGAPDERTAQLHALIDRQARQLGRLVDDLLDVARVMSNKIRLRRVPVELRDLARGCLQALDTRRHEVSFTADAVPLIVEGDPARLEQVITNLLTNALKYTPPGGHIHLMVHRAGGEAVLRVVDNGVGIEPAKLPEIFELFRQADESLARAQGGLGVGLTVVRRLVELHGGCVEADSAGLGRGATFTVRLPLWVAAPAPAVDAGAGEPAAPEPAVIPRHIVLIEDSPDNRETLQTLLELEGHRVEVAADGPRGLAAVLASQPEVALVDIGLPGLNGYEVARRIRSAPGGDRILLIALTGYGLPEDRRRALAAGFDTHLVKPVDLKELARLLAQLPARNGQPPPSDQPS